MARGSVKECRHIASVTITDINNGLPQLLASEQCPIPRRDVYIVCLCLSHNAGNHLEGSFLKKPCLRLDGPVIAIRVSTLSSGSRINRFLSLCGNRAPLQDAITR